MLGVPEGCFGKYSYEVGLINKLLSDRMPIAFGHFFIKKLGICKISRNFVVHSLFERRI